MPLETKPCVNCNLHTPITQSRCIHCERPREVKIPMKLPGAHRIATAADIAAYEQYLRKEMIQ